MLRAASPSHPPPRASTAVRSAPPRPQAGGERKKKRVSTRGARASITPGGRGFVCINPDCDEASLALRPLASSPLSTLTHPSALAAANPHSAAPPRRLLTPPPLRAPLSLPTTAPLPPRLQFRDTAEGIFEHIERAHPGLEPRREVRNGNEAPRVVE